MWQSVFFPRICLKTHFKVVMILPKALVTGASSGIGEEMARILSGMGYETILVARRTDRLKSLQKELPAPSYIVTADLGNMDDVQKIVQEHPFVDVLINNAGFGVFGEFTQTDFEKESALIDVNIRALHFLMKAYLPQMKKNGGKILNVASTAAFFPGPVFSSYYASKAYVYRLSLAIREELRREKAPVSVSVLCPGPVRTEFNDVAGVKFGIGSISAQYAAKKAISGMLRGKAVIVPGFGIKVTRLISGIIPGTASSKIVYHLQKAKKK